MNPLDQLAGWPVPHAAAAVIGPAGVIATWGDIDRPFYLASVTKPLAAVATLIAVEEGAVELDQPLAGPLAALLPGVTLRHLLAHASGIAPERRMRVAPPGTRRIYSNAGFDAIGEIVAGATDMAFADYLREAVFEPLGMPGAALPDSDHGIGSPAKDATASVTDLCAFVGELIAPTGLLTPGTVTDAITVQYPGLSGVLPGFGSQRANDWGLGFEIRSAKTPHWTANQNSPQTFGHFGRSGTMFWVDPQVRLGLVALTDHEFGSWAIQSWPVLGSSVLEAFG